MKAKILQENATAYQQMDLNSSSIRILHTGEEVELGSAKQAQGKKWVEVTLSDGTRGFLPGDTRIFSMIQATTNQPKTLLYATPSRQSIKAELKKRTLLNFLNMIEQDGEQWIHVQDASGGQGYIEATTKIIPKPRVTKKTGLQNMLIGGLFFVVGTIITISTYSSASISGGTYYICWGAILFGAIQFIQGLIQFLTAPEN